MPPECLERIVYHAAHDHRVLSTLMQVNSTLFRIATPYIYREPFRFRFGDEFQLDWDTETWTRHLREVRHAKLLLLYLSCTETVQTLLFRPKKDKGKGATKGIRLPDTAVQRHKYLSKMHPHQLSQPQHQQEIAGGGQRLQGQSAAAAAGSHATSTMEQESDSYRNNHHNHHYSRPPQPIVRIPESLEKLLRSHIICERLMNNTSPRPLRRMSLVAFSGKADSVAGGILPKPNTVNYLDYIEHLDLDSFLDTSIQVLFSSSAAALTGLRTSSMVPLASHALKDDHYVAERLFTERVLLQSTAQHITILSFSVATFARLQRDIMEHLVGPSSPSSSPSTPSSVTPTNTKNRAGLRIGTPLSQLSRLNISGLHAELKPKVLRAIRWFLRRHVSVYPGVLTAITFEGTGDTTVNRRRQRNRNVIGVEPILPGVVHFNNQYTDHVDTMDEVEDELEGGAANPNSHGESPVAGLFVDAAGHINNIFSGPHIAAAEAVPADFHSQYYLLSRNPDESCELDFMGIVQELAGQLEVLDLSRWSWSAITRQALDMIPTERLSTLRFHPRTRIMSPHGSVFLKRFSMLKVLEIHAFDEAMLDLDSDSIDLVPSTSTTTSTPLSSQVSLSTLTLTGSVPNVLPAVHDAIRLMGKSLDTIDLTAHLDGYLSTQDTLRLMDWSTSLSTSSIPCLTTLQLHGHLAMTFNAPLLLELCPTLRCFGLTIKSYTSSSFIRTEFARVLPRFMVTPDRDVIGINSLGGQRFMDLTLMTTTATGASPKFHLKVLELEGPWILTERDVKQIGDQISGLVFLNLVGCRFYPARRGDRDDEEERVDQDEESPPVVRLVERVQETLRTLRIHRRGLEGKPRRDSAEYHIPAATTATTSKSMSTLPTFHHTSSSSLLLSSSAAEETRLEPVMAFKKRFPNVKLQIREKQHENSFVLAPSAETLRRIHHRPPLRTRTTSLFSDMLGQPSMPYRMHEFAGQSSMWRRARNAVPFFKRHKTYSPNGFENGQIRSWGRGGGLRRSSVSLSRFFRG
ncbi:hypothetical protein BGZ65_002549 [Modicella reniformis]|uniref:Uncharacterized protein n=1 Tax=Modicella reniformis TaxID=1440133 RepID=A0A9P6M9L9_9FUNG|nr:hypothetical protein BGZ65_002549 [Modicella reniformis]